LFFFCYSAEEFQGEIIHKEGLPHTHPGDFVFTPNSHVVVTLKRAEGAGFSTVIKEKILRDISRFPIPFYIQPGKPLDFSKGFTYFYFR